MAQQKTVYDWENLAVIQRNKQPGHALAFATAVPKNRLNESNHRSNSR